MSVSPPATYPQKLPATGPAREALRQKGQFWTPDWVAQAMVAYVTAGGADHLFDPAVGAGAFFRAAKAVAAQTNRHFTLLGTEIDAAALGEARRSGLADCDLTGVQICDFILCPPTDRFQAIVANPPYIRHHRLPPALKDALKRLGTRLIGKPLDGRAGLHVYFLLQALQLLGSAGRLAFIMPADTCEGVSAPTLWRWVTQNYCLDAVITFTPQAAPFPTVDTNALIFFIRNAPPPSQLRWAVCSLAGKDPLKAWALADLSAPSADGLAVYRRDLAEALATGLSRPPLVPQPGNVTLADFAKVVRGVATGANEFFFLTEAQAATLGLAEEFLKPAIGRVRDVATDLLSGEMLDRLAAKGRPTRLFAPDSRPLDRYPERTRQYLQQGERLGINTRILISTRNPWYKMETRRIPPILFAYLGRRDARFIRNQAGALPLTCFLCVYPRDDDAVFIEKLWHVLSHPLTLANLALVGKSYGSGAIKVEPRALESLPLPLSVVQAAGLLTDLRPSSQQEQQATFGW